MDESICTYLEHNSQLGGQKKKNKQGDILLLFSTCPWAK